MTTKKEIKNYSQKVWDILMDLRNSGLSSEIDSVDNVNEYTYDLCLYQFGTDSKDLVDKVMNEMGINFDD